MQPDDSRPNNPIIPRRPYLRPDAERARPEVHEAAANVVRGQINTIYQTPPKSAPITPVSDQTDVNPYDRTHQANRTTIHADQWKRYHSAWQDYYRQYYERYYLGEVYRMRQTLETSAKGQGDGQQPAVGLTASENRPDSESIMYDLKSTLVQKVGTSAVKVRKSRHFVPVIAALVVMLTYLFISYNVRLSGIAMAIVSPGSIDPANIITDPNISVPVSNEPKLIIPKINVDVPVVYDTKPDQESQLKAMEGGVAWFGIPGANSKPGQVGNTVLAGHSSNDLFDGGNYKFIFARLEQLIVGDTFYMNYEGKRYTYSVVRKEVVRPTDVQKLVYETDKPVVTLITCVPVGTAQSRLLVTAEQVSPNPSLAQAAPASSEADSELPALAGNSPSLIERMFRTD